MTKNRKARTEAESSLRQHAQRLGLHGLLAHWQEVADQPWLKTVLEYEEVERNKRGLQRRIQHARLGRFKPFADFNWSWPKKIDRELLEELFHLEFLAETANVIIVGPNGVGKTMIAKNLAHQAILRGYTAHFTTASELLNKLAAQDSGSALLRRLKHYTRPQLLVIDEVGYLSTSNHHADLLFEVITRRYQEKSIILTTNKPFSEWNEVFPNSTCVVTLIDRLIHKAEILKIDGESYRLKEAKERSKNRERKRSAKRAAAKKR